MGSDDQVVVVMPKSEMGQGTHAGLAMVLADELDADIDAALAGTLCRGGTYPRTRAVIHQAGAALAD